MEEMVAGWDLAREACLAGAWLVAILVACAVDCTVVVAADSDGVAARIGAVWLLISWCYPPPVLCRAISWSVRAVRC